MKKHLFLLLVTGIAVTSGCNEGTPGGPGVTSNDGNPGTVDTTDQPTYGEAERTFSLDVPVLSTTLMQGETETVTFSLSRGVNFEEDVTIEITGLPQGVTADPASAKIARSEKEVLIKFSAASDAALGDFTVNVVGHPTKGEDATSQMKLTVAKND